MLSEASDAGAFSQHTGYGVGSSFEREFDSHGSSLHQPTSKFKVACSKKSVVFSSIAVLLVGVTGLAVLRPHIAENAMRAIAKFVYMPSPRPSEAAPTLVLPVHVPANPASVPDVTDRVPTPSGVEFRLPGMPSVAASVGPINIDVQEQEGLFNEKGGGEAGKSLAMIEEDIQRLQQHDDEISTQLAQLRSRVGKIMEEAQRDGEAKIAPSPAHAHAKVTLGCLIGIIVIVALVMGKRLGYINVLGVGSVAFNFIIDNLFSKRSTEEFVDLEAGAMHRSSSLLFPGEPVFLSPRAPGPPAAIVDFGQYRRSAPVVASAAGADESPMEEISDAMLVKKTRKGKFKAYKPKDNRDALLYKITDIAPPPTRLGTFRLSPVAGCGDRISVRIKGTMKYYEEEFVIKRVSYRYAYGPGGYRMVGKEADVKKVSREATEAFLRRMLPTEENREKAKDAPQTG